MLRWVNLIFPVVLIVLLSGFTHIGKDYQLAGEIPWPLSNQRAVTESTSKGLWDLESYETHRLFNVEMVTEYDSGYDWIRVAELNPSTYEVISWGEGVFNATGVNSLMNPVVKPRLSNVSLSPALEEDQYGRYITMFPNGDFAKEPYLIRLVEVKVPKGHVLGLSIINYIEQKNEHMLGSRILGNPLKCDSSGSQEGKLDCFFD